MTNKGAKRTFEMQQNQSRFVAAPLDSGPHRIGALFASGFRWGLA